MLEALAIVVNLKVALTVALPKYGLELKYADTATDFEPSLLWVMVFDPEPNVKVL